MTDQPLIHPSLKTTISALVANTPQALLITGPVGVGLRTLAEYIARQLSAFPQIVLPEKDEVINLEKGVISVSLIRRLYHQTRSIETGKRVMVIDMAETMGIQAQNAFLKLLEEPTDNTHFIIVSHTASLLLPTVLSRVQRLDVRPLTSAQSSKLLDTLDIANKTKRIQLLFMAEGLPAELTRLVGDSDYFDSQVELMRDARTLLQAKTYDKLLLSTKYREDRTAVLKLITFAISIVRKTISQTPNQALIKQLELLSAAYDRIGSNGNIRLQLAALVV